MGNTMGVYNNGSLAGPYYHLLVCIYTLWYGIGEFIANKCLLGIMEITLYCRKDAGTIVCLGDMILTMLLCYWYG